ncbi:MAG: ferritin family protein [Thermoplasmata archaeon]
MELEEYDFDELLRAAAKSEVNSREVYEYLSDRTDNFVIKNRFEFLAGEEKKHQDFITDLYEKRNPRKEMEVPEETPVPIPFIRYGDDIEESEIVEQSMDAEISARDFYKKMANIARDEGESGEPVKLLDYLSGMEQNHYDILKSELERIEEFEEFDQYHPAMHQGP